MAACEGRLSSPLAEALVSSTWLSGCASGNCIECEGCMRFYLDGKAEHILSDSNACETARRGTFITPHRHALEGRTLTMSSQLSRSRFDIAAGTIAGTRLLFIHRRSAPCRAVAPCGIGRLSGRRGFRARCLRPQGRVRA
jgi:hypothetical protein